MADSIPEFLSLYSTRPILLNKGGMGLNHSWATWYIVKTLNPDLLVESGVWLGHSTWLLEKAAPNAKIISFDISFANRSYFSNSVSYQERDLTDYDWSRHDLSNSLVFLDDHQNHYERLIHCYWFGFKRFILEDVYPIKERDFYSLKHLQNGSGINSLNLSKRFRGNRRTRRTRRKNEEFLRKWGKNQLHIVEPNTSNWQNLKSKIKCIQELPPIFLNNRTIWGTTYENEYKTQKPLLSDLPKGEFDLSFNYLTYIELI